MDGAFEQPDLIKDIPVHSRGVTLDDLFKAPSNANRSMILLSNFSMTMGVRECSETSGVQGASISLPMPSAGSPWMSSSLNSRKVGAAAPEPSLEQALHAQAGA